MAIERFDLMGRRDALALMAAVAAVPVSMRVAAARQPQADAPFGHAAVGYWPASAAWRDIGGLALADRPLDAAPARAHSWAAVDASRLAHGDPVFAVSGARITVLGLGTLPGASGARPAAVELFAHGGPARDIPFHVWGLADRAVSAAGAPVRVTVPVGAGGLRLDLAVGGDKGTDRSPGVRIPVTFALDAGPGIAKLRRGLYAIAWSDSGREPVADWSAYRIRDDAAGGQPVADAPPARLHVEAPRPQWRRAAAVLVAIDHAVADAVA